MTVIKPIKAEASKKMVKIKTVSEFKNWFAKMEPMLQDTKTDDIKFREVKHNEYFLKKRKAQKANTEIKKQIDKSFQIKINNILNLVDEIKNIVNPVKDSTNNLAGFLQRGLDSLMCPRTNSGLFVIKNISNPEEFASINPPNKNGYFRMVVNDAQGEPKRWYYIANNHLVRNFHPKKFFQYDRSIYANESEVEKVKDSFNTDLDWATETLLKSIDFIKKDLKSQKKDNVLF